MDVTEKLIKLTADRGKAQVAKAAGLPKSAISNYIAKRQMPRGDNALAIARALDVPLDWLVDNTRDWPPPKAELDSPAMLSDETIIGEFHRRLVYAALDMRAALEAAENRDWRGAAIRLAELAKDEKVPAEIASLLSVEDALEGRRSQLNRFDMEREGEEFWMHPAVEPEKAHELSIKELVKRHRALASTGDYGKFRHLVFLRLLDTSMPQGVERFDRERRQILDELRKKRSS